MVVLIIVAQAEKHSSGPSIRTEKQIVVHSHSIMTFGNEKKKTKHLLLLAMVWMNLTSIIISERSQAYNTFSMTPVIQSTKSGKTYLGC